MKPSLTGVCIALAIAVGVHAEPVVVDQIVAVVEDEVITQSEVTEQLQLYLVELQIDPSSNPAMADSLRREVLTQLVDNMLVVKEAERRGIEVTDQQIEAYLDQQIAQIEERFGGEEAFLRQLELEGVSLKKMKQFYRDDIRRQLLSSQLVGAEVDTELEITDEMLLAYFEEHRSEMPRKEAEVRLRHLLIRPKPEASREVEVRRTMENALSRVQAGEDFASVAKEISQDPTAATGGNLGWFKAEDFADPIFFEVASTLADGEISDVVRSGYGYHIIQKLESRGNEVRARHIVIPHELTQADVDRSEKLMEQVVRRLNEGAEFVDMVRAYSDAPEADGDVGYFPLDGLFPHYRKAIEGLEVGEFSEVVPDQQGLHIFKVMERTEAKEYTFEEVKPQIQELLRRETIAKRYKDWVDTLRERSFVEFRNT